MLKHLIGATTLLLLSSTALAENPRVQLTTNLGDIVVELNEEQAPISAANFLRYVEAGHYDGVIFHRVIPGFMIQTGGFDSNMRQRETRQPDQERSRQRPAQSALHPRHGPYRRSRQRHQPVLHQSG